MNTNIHRPTRRQWVRLACTALCVGAAGIAIAQDYPSKPVKVVAHSAPDRYTLLVATTAHAINPSLFGKLNYQLLKDFAPVSLLTSGPLVIVANPALPANNVQELIALAKSGPKGLSFGSSGKGQSTHLAAELINSMAGTKMSHVLNKGRAPAVTSAQRSPVAPELR